MGSWTRTEKIEGASLGIGLVLGLNRLKDALPGGHSADFFKKSARSLQNGEVFYVLYRVKASGADVLRS